MDGISRLGIRSCGKVVEVDIRELRREGRSEKLLRVDKDRIVRILQA